MKEEDEQARKAAAEQAERERLAAIAADLERRIQEALDRQAQRTYKEDAQ